MPMMWTPPRLSMRLALGLSLLVIAAAQGINYATGHPLICRCGFMKLWHGGANDAQLSQHVTDWLTYAHVLRGILFYWLLTYLARGHLSLAARLLIAVILEAGWEVGENSAWFMHTVRPAGLAYGNFGDTIVNSATDILAMMAGFLVAARLPAWVTVFLLIAFEAAMMALTGDSFVLRAIDRAAAMPSIRHWFPLG